MRRVIGLATIVLAAGSTAHAIKVSPYPPPPPPDLVVSAYAVPSPSVVHCGSQTIVFSITETNLGAGPAGPYTTYHFSNGVAFCARSRPGLAAGQSLTFTDSCVLWNGPCDCSPGSYTIPFFSVVDALNVVAETNEGNNTSPTVIKPAQCP